ncbi:MBG domain-containing protein, partial [Pedobacter sp. MC2016-24]|uniref:beta strand repeat-containing protein n=1 Tax=Pedobacter sp. MC2016-24 TaxID=2780090 RepID=UPI001A0780EA
MRKFYFKKFFLCLLLCVAASVLPNFTKAQTTLSAGDIIFTGFDSSPAIGSDKFSFVLLANISAGTVINFTDKGYFGSGWQAENNASETSISWTSATALPIGTEITITGLTASKGTVIGLGSSGTALSLSNVGDQIIAYQGGGINPASGTKIAGIHWSYCTLSPYTTTAGWDVGGCGMGPNFSALPPGLTGGTNAFWPGVSGNNIYTQGAFNGTGVPAGSVANIRSAVMNQANWTLSSAPTTSTTTLPTGFTYYGAAPTITGNPANRTVCANGATTFTVTAQQATSYQWQVNTGAGFNDIQAGAPYSGITGTTLTVSPVVASMSGYTYRCVVTGATGNATSNSATLTTNVVTGTAAVTQVSCYGGSNGAAAITVTSGIGPFSYAWSPRGGTGSVANGLTAGTYTCTITDNLTCQGTVTVVITEPTSALAATISASNNVSCPGGNNGSATVSASGGTPGYTYLWSNGATTPSISGILAGTYNVTVTDLKGCTTTASATIDQPAAFVTGYSTTPVNCSGGSNGTATVTVNSGGQAPFTYQWSAAAGSQTTQTATGLSAGTYTCTITDANLCSKTITGIAVTQPSVLVAVMSFTDVSCHGGSNGSATVSPSGGNGGYTYLWTNGYTGQTATNLVAGPISCTVTDAKGCAVTKNFTIGQPASLVASQGAINNVSCNGGSNGTATVLVTGGTAPYTYDWNGTPTGDGTATISGLAMGTYTVTVKDANLCQTTQSFTISQPAAFTVTTSQTDILCNGSATGAASVNVSGGTGAYSYLWSPSGGTQASATGLTAGTYTVAIKDANLCQTTRTFTITEPAALVATAGAQTNINCRNEANGSATVNVTGGTGAYTYSWSPSGGTQATASGLAAGTYTVTVKDANLCQTTQSFTITQPAAILSATTASTGVSCFGGSNGTATVNVSGGTPTYSYLWAPLGGTSASISGRPAGNYTCTITDSKGCTLVKNVTIATPAAFSATMSKTDVSCSGGTNGSATVVASGATAPYSYAWSPTGGTQATASGLAAGNYTVTITDVNTCSYTVSVTIGQPAALSVTSSKTDVLCNGSATGSATVNVSGGTPGYTYLWSPSGGTAATASGLNAGNYNCLVTDANGCTFTQNFTIGQPAVLSATTSQINATCTTGGQASVSVAGGAASYTYLWSPSGQTTQIATGLAPGAHSVLITDANGCTLSKNFTISTTNTLVAATSKTDVLCNGSNTGSVTVVPSGAPGPFTYVWAPSGGNAATASNLTAGNYSVTITSANGCSIVKNFTINEPAAFVVTPSQTNIACYGSATGTAGVVVSGGTGAYSYVWAPRGGTAATATGLSAGTYVVTVTDANLCQTTQSFTITEPSAITASTSQTNVTTALGSNGSATVTATGGTGAYSYVWSPTGGTAATATGLGSGNYTVTVTDANGCSLVKNVTIVEPASISSFAAISKVYGDASFNITAPVSNSPGAFSYTSSDPAVASVNGNTITVIKTGTTTITATQAASGNYAQTVATTTLSVNAKQLTINNIGRSKVYGQVLTGTDFSGTITGLENGDNISVNRTSTGAAATAAVGNYPIVATVVDPGNKLGNYTVTNPNGTLSVTAKALTIASTDRSKVYGQVLTGTDFSGTITGLENGDNISVNRTSTGAAATAAVGNYPIVATVVDPGNKIGNYTLVNPNGALTVTAKALTIAITDRSKVYGQVLTGTDFVGTITGLENGDNISVNRTSTGAAATAAVGNYPIVASIVDPGNKLGNYTVSNPNGVLTVTAKALTIASTDRSKVYGQVLTGTDFAGTITGLENG